MRCLPEAMLVDSLGHGVCSSRVEPRAQGSRLKHGAASQPQGGTASGAYSWHMGDFGFDSLHHRCQSREQMDQSKAGCWNCLGWG